jgi:glutamate racemase
MIDEKMVVFRMNRNDKIGVFDSGLGGLSVLYEIHKSLPHENLIYVGDSLNAPYGIKSKEEVFQLAKAICDKFISQNCKAIVIACNTATSAAVTRLRAIYDIPIIGMEPAIKPALERSKGNVLVMATEMTLSESKFANLMMTIKGSERIIKWPAPMLVPLVEDHFDNIQVKMKTLQQCFYGLNASPEVIVLGCTHFVFLKNDIQQFFHENVCVIDGNKGTVQQLLRQLEKFKCLNHQSEIGSIELKNSKGDAYVKKSWEMLDYLEKGCDHHGL